MLYLTEQAELKASIGSVVHLFPVLYGILLSLNKEFKLHCCLMDNHPTTVMMADPHWSSLEASNTYMHMILSAARESPYQSTLNFCQRFREEKQQQNPTNNAREAAADAVNL